MPYLIILKEPVDGKLQITSDFVICMDNGVYVYPGTHIIPLSSIDSIIVKPE